MDLIKQILSCIVMLIVPIMFIAGVYLVIGTVFVFIKELWKSLNRKEG